MAEPTIIVDITSLLKILDRDLNIISYTHDRNDNERHINFTIKGQYDILPDKYYITVNTQHLYVAFTIFDASGHDTDGSFDILKKNLSTPLLTQLIDKVETVGLTWVNSII